MLLNNVLSQPTTNAELNVAKGRESQTTSDTVNLNGFAKNHMGNLLLASTMVVTTLLSYGFEALGTSTSDVRPNIMPSYHPLNTNKASIKLPFDDWRSVFEVQKTWTKVIEVLEFNKVNNHESRIFPVLARESTRNFILRLNVLIEVNHLKWAAPHVAIEDDNKIVLEWWNDSHNLSFYISDDGQVEFLQAWGPNIWHEMVDGVAPTDSRLVELWAWLYT